jgi:hypothetical protein
MEREVEVKNCQGVLMIAVPKITRQWLARVESWRTSFG